VPTRATYLELAETLADRVAHARTAERLPSEHELAAAYGVSRITARAAMQELERRHLVQRVRGSGTFVAPRIDYVLSPSMPPSWTETVRAAGHDASSEVTALHEGAADATVAERLEVPVGSPTFVLERRSDIDGSAAGVGRSHVPADLVPAIGQRLHRSGSLFRTLVAYGHDPVRASVRAELAVVPAHVGTALGLDGRPLVWRIESRNRCARSGRVLEHSVGWMRADVLRVVFELDEAFGRDEAFELDETGGTDRRAEGTGGAETCS
jgi:DNA-binding GntR family transcriptional regulator